MFLIGYRTSHSLCYVCLKNSDGRVKFREKMMLPISTAECEGGFSAINHILTDGRNRMNVSTFMMWVKEVITPQMIFAWEKIWERIQNCVIKADCFLSLTNCHSVFGMFTAPCAIQLIALLE